MNVDPERIGERPYVETGRTGPANPKCRKLAIPQKPGLHSDHALLRRDVEIKHSPLPTVPL